MLGDGGKVNHSMDNNGCSGDGPLDCRRATWSHANNVLLLGPMLDQTMNFGRSGPHDVYTHLSNNVENPFYFDGIFPLVDYSLLIASPPNLPTLEPLLETGSDGSRSLSSSPSSTYSTLYFNDDVASLSLANNVSQEPLLYNLL